MTTISHILFDLGNVVISIAPDRVTDELARLSNRSRAECIALLTSPGSVWQQMAVGRYSSGDLRDWINYHLDLTLSSDEIERIMNLELVSEIGSTASLFPILSQQAFIGCLSNTNAIHWAELLREYRVMDSFSHRFASQELLLSKPSQEIYQRVEEILAVPAENILFFDDREENIVAAAACGWRARQYVGHDQLVQDLRKSGFGV